MRLEIFEKILTNFILFIGKLHRNPEMIVDDGRTKNLEEKAKKRQNKAEKAGER